MLYIASFVAQDSFFSSLSSFEIATFDFLSFPNEKKTYFKFFLDEESTV